MCKCKIPDLTIAGTIGPGCKCQLEEILSFTQIKKTILSDFIKSGQVSTTASSILPKNNHIADVLINGIDRFIDQCSRGNMLCCLYCSKCDDFYRHADRINSLNIRQLTKHNHKMLFNLCIYFYNYTNYTRNLCPMKRLIITERKARQDELRLELLKFMPRGIEICVIKYINWE